MSTSAAPAIPTRLPAGRNYARRYWVFAVPAAIVVAAVIVFPWIFTLFMSVHDWKVSGATPFVGLANYAKMLTDERFQWAIVRTLVFTAASVVAPVILGVWAAVCFASNFRGRGLARTIFVLPMMATPVAISLVWTMMFHPQLGVLNYLLSLVGLPPSAWVYDSATVIPTLVMVETWQWTPLVMLIVLGGIASLPTDPYEAAILDGATTWQMFRHITLPLAWPFIVVASVIRMIDALKAFDTIYVITLGGPGTSSETLNILLYQTAFAYYDLGYGSAMVVVFFVLILLVSMLLLHIRQKQAFQ
jgi:multiple sugar transport system permease protein